MARKRNPKARKPKRANKQKKRSNKIPLSVNPAALRKICSITDPFCNAARGAKTHDGTNLRTMAVQCTGFHYLGTNAGGVGAAAFSADPSIGILNTATITGGTLSTWTTGQKYSGWTSMPAGAQWRLVSGGVLATSRLSMMNNSGEIGILAIPSSSLTTSIAGVNVDSLSFEVNVRTPSSDTNGLAAIVKSDHTNSDLFRDQALTLPLNFAPSYGNDILIVYIIGGPATQSAVAIKYVYNYEVTFPMDTVFNHIATPAAKQDPTLNAAANDARGIVSTVVRGGVKAVESAVMNAAKQALVYGAQAAGSYFLGPGAGMAIGGAAHAGMIMDVD